MSPLSAREGLERLRQGNARFRANRASSTRPAELPQGQQPFAIILGCSDSRVPAEIIFDQGLGDLFVIRVAGNIVAPSQVASVEFAAELFGTRLVVVVGHSECGAVTATIAELQGTSPRKANLASIIDRVRPAVAPLMGTELRKDRAGLMRAAVRANIVASAAHLRHGSAIIEDLVAREGLLVVGAEYSLDTGVVDFFDGV